MNRSWDWQLFLIKRKGLFGAWDAMAYKHSCFFRLFHLFVFSCFVFGNFLFVVPCIQLHRISGSHTFVVIVLFAAEPFCSFRFSMAWVFPRLFPINFDLLFVMAIQQSDSGKCERAYKCMLQIRPDGNGWKDKQVKHACIVYMEHLIERTDDCFLAIFFFRSASSLLLVVSGLSVANASKKRISIALAFGRSGNFLLRKISQRKNGMYRAKRCKNALFETNEAATSAAYQRTNHPTDLTNNRSIESNEILENVK